MVSSTASPTYTTVAKALHWLIALGVVTLIGLGLAMTRLKLPLEDKFALYQNHKSIGLTVLALMVLRILWRLTHRPPALPSDMPALERTAAHLAHLGLYVLLIAIPVCGWLMVSASPLPVPTRVFGWLPVPHLPIEVSKSNAALFKDWHWIMAYVLGTLVVVHIAAALRHHLVLKDDILRRMLPRRRGGRGTIGGLTALTVLTGIMTISGIPAQAQEAPRWSIDAAKSSVTFEASAAGQKYPGKFERFGIEIAFDPAAPERTRIKVLIGLDSARTGTDDIDSELAAKNWFDAKQFPQGIYVADKCERTAQGYKLIGTLTLKGKTLPLEIPFTVQVDGKRATAKGEATIDRLAFGVGPEGPIAGAVVDSQVRLLIAIEAERAGP